MSALSSKAFGRVFAVSLVILTGYAIFAEVADFHLITLRAPGSSRLAHRLSECGVLWTLFWSGAGWVLTAKKRIWDHMAWSWMIVLAPVLGGLLSSLAQGRIIFFAEARVRASGQFAWLDYAITMTPFAQGIVLGLVLLVHARIWRVLGRAGRYCRCGYDLTGNVSGTCPECGTKIERRASLIGHRSGTLSGRWLIFSGAVIALYGAVVMPWISAMRDRQAGVSGTIVVVVGIALVIMGIGLKRGWWQ
jgi:hypothetical protein